MGCRLVLIRHGLTYWNVKKKMQGQVNIPLNQTGIQQAKQLSESLKDYHFDVCYSSPLDRAYMTAKLALKDRDVPIHKDLRLVEHGYGLLESHSYKHWPWFRWTNEAYNYESHPERFHAPIGGYPCRRARRHKLRNHGTFARHSPRGFLERQAGKLRVHRLGREERVVPNHLLHSRRNQVLVGKRRTKERGRLTGAPALLIRF